MRTAQPSSASCTNEVSARVASSAAPSNPSATSSLLLGYDKKNPERTNGRNGSRGRVWGTRAGFRDHTSFFPRWGCVPRGWVKKNGPLNQE
jgi:hypothetical protein